MKKYLILIISFVLIGFSGFSQVQATIKVGSQGNSVYITFKPLTTITAAKFSTFQFAVGIPTSVSTGVSAAVVSLDPLISYVPLPSTENQGGVDYQVFSFSGDGGQSGAGTTFTAGMEYNYAEVFFYGTPVTITDVRLMQLAAGGTSGTVNFYVSNSGTDVVNQEAQFYSSVPANASNDGLGYEGSSFVRVGPVVVPVKFVGFEVTKKNTDAVLSWQIENESALTDRYEVERSLNGVDFKKVATVAAKNNGNSSNSYELSDLNLTSIRSSGMFYYRIKQVDKDGRSIYTSIKSLRLNSKGLSIGVFPNPIKNYANVTIDLEQDANTFISINDAAGKEVQIVQLKLFKGPNIKKINMAGLAAGSYLLKVQTPTEIKTIPVVKSN